MLLAILIIQIGLFITLITSLIYTKKGLFQTQKNLDELTRLIEYNQSNHIESNSLEEINEAVHIDWDDESEYWAEVEQKRTAI